MGNIIAFWFVTAATNKRIFHITHSWQTVRFWTLEHCNLSVFFLGDQCGNNSFKSMQYICVNEKKKRLCVYNLWSTSVLESLFWKIKSVCAMIMPLVTFSNILLPIVLGSRSVQGEINYWTWNSSHCAVQNDIQIGYMHSSSVIFRVGDLLPSE